MWKKTPHNYTSSLLGPEDGAMTHVNIVCPFKCCHQASNLEYLKDCVRQREQVPRLVKEKQAAVAASSPAESEVTTEFASPDSPPTELSPEQVRQVREKTSCLRALAKGIMAVGGMPMTPSPMEAKTSATSATPASAVGADSDDSDEEGPVRKVVLPILEEEGVPEESADVGGASSSMLLFAVPTSDTSLLSKASQAMLRYLSLIHI